jgi:hypothetical protein
MHLSRLKSFMMENKDVSCFYIYTDIANYYDDKITLYNELSSMLISKKPFTQSKIIKIKNNFDFNGVPDDCKYIYYNPIGVSREVARKIRNGKLHSNPYVAGENKSFLLKQDEINEISTIEEMKLITKQIASFLTQNSITTFSIDATLSPDEFLITKDILSQLILIHPNIRWCFVGENSALKVLEKRQLQNLDKFKKVTWDAIIPFDRDCYVSLVSDEYTMKETQLVPFGLRSVTNEFADINLYKPQLVV